MASKRTYALGVLALASASLFGAAAAFAQAPAVSAPIIYRNMAVYAIEEGTTSASTPITIGQALKHGLARIDQGSNGNVSVDNLSSRSIFVPFGTLLTGGTQDQVVGLNTLVPAHAKGTPLDVFCVDPFRNTARQSENVNAFATSGELIPSETAQLSMLLNTADSDPVWNIRQAGVWWSIDTLRSQLQQALGTLLKPATREHWTLDFSTHNPAMHVLFFRNPFWVASLPQALSDLHLRKAQALYMRAFRALPRSRSRITGAAFVVDGKVVGAEIYHSPQLFRQMWPQLLRAYATEAIAARKPTHWRAPSVAVLRDFLSAVHADAAKRWTIGKSTSIRDTNNVLYSEFRDSNGAMIAASYVSKSLPLRALMTPDALVADILERDNLATLGPNDEIGFRRSAIGRWSATISGIPSAVAVSNTRAFPAQAPSAVGSPFAMRCAVVLPVMIFLLTAIGLVLRKRSTLGLSNRFFTIRRCLVSALKRFSRKGTAMLSRPLIPSPAAVLRILIFFPQYGSLQKLQRQTGDNARQKRDRLAHYRNRG